MLNLYFILNTENNREIFPENFICKYLYDEEPPKGADVKELFTDDAGTTYPTATHPEVLETLQNALKVNTEFGRKYQRFVIVYGDRETGEAWNHPDDENRESGYISRSTGKYKVPLLIHSRRSDGGPAIMPEHIIMIKTAKGKHVLYQHPNFHYSTDAAQ